MAEIRRHSSLCNSRKSFQEARAVLLHRLTKSGIELPFSSPETFDPWIMQKAITRRPLRVATSGALWLVLPYHPVWHKGRLHQALADLTRGPAGVYLNAVFGRLAPPISISWKLAGPPLLIKCRRALKGWLEGKDGGSNNNKLSSLSQHAFTCQSVAMGSR